MINIENLHFANPAWLWGIVAVPVVWLLFVLFYRPYHPLKKLEQFIDSHLLPFLLIGNQKGNRSYVKALILWSFVWACLTLSLAGPRWNFREIEVLSKDQSLVILLDLSESMNANDIKPSRLIRAKQKIEDLLNKSTGVKIGLVAFAADPHMISPLTDDKETIRHLLPSLDTNLIYIQGSKLSSALDMASVMLDSEPGTNKAVLVISDGELEDGSALASAKKIAAKGVHIYSMGVGTTEGAILQDKEGNSIRKNGSPILSKLMKSQLEEISKIGKGRYLNPYGEEEEVILKQLSDRANAMNAGKTNRLWDEGYYVFIFPVLPIFLWWFRKGVMFLIPFLVLFPSMRLQADLKDFNKHYFMNAEEAAQAAFDDDDFKTAASEFQDPYRKGVAYYKAGDFAEAEKMFRQSSRPEVAADAGYNLGNALVKQNKLKKAITAYEKVLKKWPDHTQAKENLEVVKKILEQQKQNQKNQKDQDKQDKDNQDQDDQEDQQDQQNQQDKNNQQDKQDRQDKEEGEQDNQQNNEDQENQQDKQDRERQDKQDKEEDQQNSEDDSQDDSNNDEQDSEDNDSEQDEQQESAEDDEQDDSEDEQEAGLSEDKHDGETEEKEGMALKSQEDQEADAWLNLLSNDPKDFLRNKFYIESKKNGTKEGIDPW